METFDLKAFRTDKKLTQKELSNIFGCNQNFISRIESGERPLPADKIPLLASRYGDITKYFREIMPITVNQNKNSPNAILGNNNKVTTSADNTALIELYKNRIEALEIENKYLKDRISYLETTNTQLINLLNKQ